MRKTMQPHSRYIGIVVAVTGLVAVAAFAQRHRAASPEPPAYMAVAYVNGVPITKANVDSRIAALTAQAGSPANPADVRALALKLEINDEILYQAAPNYGITISQANLEGIANQAAQQILAGGDESTKSEFQDNLQHLGITVEQYSHDTRVLSAYKRGFLISSMRRWIEDRMAPEDRISQQAILTAIDQFIANQHATVTYR